MSNITLGRLTSALTAVLAALVVTPVVAQAPEHEEEAVSPRTLFDFGAAAAAERWFALNDGVMGGVSTGGSRATENGTLEFSGRVSLENNGGFASIRTGTGSWDLSSFDALRIRVRGDGQRYAFTVQTDFPIMAGGYYFDFQTEAGAWQETVLPFHAFSARSFGRDLPSAPPLNASDIRVLGFMIADKQVGPFRLEIARIEAVQARDLAVAHTPPTAREIHARAAALIMTAIDRGVPLFNDGGHAACAAVYEMTVRCLTELSASQLPEDAARALRQGLQAAAREADPATRAWTLRHALDAALADLTTPRAPVAEPNP